MGCTERQLSARLTHLLSALITGLIESDITTGLILEVSKLKLRVGKLLQQVARLVRE